MSQTELLDQFLSEARECLDNVGRLLLEVERRSQDKDLLNDLFRQVHTLKGNCGLFEFKALERAVHAGEDVLDRVRNGTLAYTASIADTLLDMLDFALDMIEAIEVSGCLPAQADEQSRGLAGALRAHLDQAGEGVPASPAVIGGASAPGEQTAIQAKSKATLPPWADRIPPAQLKAGRILLRYRPESECFFKGEDPWRLALHTPDLVWLDLGAAEPWPEPASFDCYRCNLDIAMASSGDEDTVRAHYRCVLEQIEWHVIEADDIQPSAADRLLQDRIDKLWIEQRRLLMTPRIAEGAVASAATVFMRLRSCAGGPVQELPHDLDGLAAWAVANAPSPAAAMPLTVGEVAGSVGADAVDVSDAASGRQRRGGEVEASIERGGPRVIKVTQEKVDTLMDLIGEIVVAKNALPYVAERAEAVFGQRELAREIKAQYAVINRIAEDMQRAIMQVRMLPVGTIFQRFSRLVRDISRKLNKEVRLVVEGEETEADKNVIEALADPLIHIIRNSLDHGIESPDKRAAAGKPREGTVRVSASQSGDRVHIEIADDGAGINVQRVKQKVLERELLSEDKVAAMTDDEAVQMVFLPGFSTADSITDLSGRGVGMDVVRTAIERINGHVSLSSRAGLGTTISLSLPLSMAVTNVMMIEAGGRRFGVPMDLIVETVRVNVEDIHAFKQARTTVLRNRIVPLRALHDLLSLGLEPIQNSDMEVAVMVIRDGNENVGLVVDDFHGTSDIILKPLEGVLCGHTGFAGTALMGDGSVLMILNPKELF
jgi:two-component system, chemotaxis family, sensor kinase CheA